MSGIATYNRTCNKCGGNFKTHSSGRRLCYECGEKKKNNNERLYSILKTGNYTTCELAKMMGFKSGISSIVSNATFVYPDIYSFLDNGKERIGLLSNLYKE